MSSRGSIADRLRMRLNREEGLKALDKVVLDHGYVEGEKYSFKDHEYQIEILRDTRQRIAVRKCSQVGLSELMVQKVLAMLAVMPFIRIIFSLPTKEMAVTFSKDRIDGAIVASDHYSAMVKAGDNSATYKKIGDSSLYVIGTYGAKAAISIPAEVIISDEVDFSNQVVLGKLESRIRHAKTVDELGNRGYRYRFSTPTVDGFGVDNEFRAGDQRYYMCRCEHCEKVVLPDFLQDFLVPGFDKPIIEFSRDTLSDPRVDISGAWIKCPSCGKNLWGSLLQPDRRMWVPKLTEVWDHSYQVSPWDVPVYNQPAAIIKSLGDYPLKSDFFNFVIGLPFSDSENTFTTDQAHKDRFCTVNLWIYMNCVVPAPTVGGMDVGKTCHLVVKTRISGGWHVIWAEKIRNTTSAPAAPEVINRYDFYRMRMLCIDAGPDITLVNLLVAARENIRAVVYVNKVAGIMPILIKPGDEVINADRTKTLRLLLEAHNTGTMWYPHNESLKQEIYDHLKTTKKIREKTEEGDFTEKFVKSDDNDHWVHALNYAGIAALTCETVEGNPVPTAPPMVSTVKVGSAQKDKPKVEESSVLLGLFGSGKPPRSTRKW